jgi:SpoVK/Ycf46/Vps4 family AAA+-type ATPase
LIEDIDLLFPAQSQDSQDFSLVSSLRQLVENIPSSCLIVATSRTDGISKDIKKLFLNHIHLQIPTPQERYFILHYLISDIKDGDLSLCKPLAQRAHGFIAADLAQWYRLAEENALVGGSEKGE